MISKPLAVALVAGLWGGASGAPAIAADYGYAPPGATWSQGYPPSYDDRAYGSPDYRAGAYGDWPAGQGGAGGSQWTFAPGGRMPSGGATGYQFRERPEDKRVERDSSPRYRPDPDLARRARGSWSPGGEAWSAPGAQGPAVIFRPWDSGSQKPTDAAAAAPEYPGWTDPGFGAPPWPGSGPGYFPPPY
jgi:hypothetical protein